MLTSENLSEDGAWYPLVPPDCSWYQAPRPSGRRRHRATRMITQATKRSSSRTMQTICVLMA